MVNKIKEILIIRIFTLNKTIIIHSSNKINNKEIPKEIKIISNNNILLINLGTLIKKIRKNKYTSKKLNKNFI